MRFTMSYTQRIMNCDVMPRTTVFLLPGSPHDSFAIYFVNACLFEEMRVPLKSAEFPLSIGVFSPQRASSPLDERQVGNHLKKVGNRCFKQTDTSGRNLDTRSFSM